MSNVILGLMVFIVAVGAFGTGYYTNEEKQIELQGMIYHQELTINKQTKIIEDFDYELLTHYNQSENQYSVMYEECYTKNLKQIEQCTSSRNLCSAVLNEEVHLLRGIYSGEGFRCVATKGWTTEEIEETECHETFHEICSENPKYCLSHFIIKGMEENE